MHIHKIISYRIVGIS